MTLRPQPGRVKELLFTLQHSQVCTISVCSNGPWWAHQQCRYAAGNLFALGLGTPELPQHCQQQNDLQASCSSAWDPIMHPESISLNLYLLDA